MICIKKRREKKGGGKKGNHILIKHLANFPYSSVLFYFTQLNFEKL